MQIFKRSKVFSPEKQESHWNQFLSVLSVTYLCISCGNFLGYTSSAIPSMKQDLETFGELSQHDISWIGGLGPLGALAGSVLTLIPLQKFGSRRTIFAIAAPALIFSWIIIGMANSVKMIFVGRFIGGMGTGMVIACAPLYVLEISSTNIRGRLGILPQFLMIFGILTSYIIGTFLPWYQLSFACALIALPSVILLSIAPDCPIWLVLRSRHEQAFHILEHFHGTKQANHFLRDMQTKVALQTLQSKKVGGVRKSRMNLGMIKACAVVLGLLSFQQLTGINGVTFYAVTIFQEASGAGINPHIPSIILASTQLVASFASTLFVERYGRKVLLIISSILLTISGTSLGTYFYFGSSFPDLAWVPLAALILFVFGFAIGFGPISWILAAEILPQETRHIMSPLAIAYSWFCVFLVTKSFPLLKFEINIYGIFWLYGGIAFLALIFVILFIPETKNLTPEEIRRFFDKSVSLEHDIDIEKYDEIRAVKDECDLEEE